MSQQKDYQSAPKRQKTQEHDDDTVTVAYMPPPSSRAPSVTSPTSQQYFSLSKRAAALSSVLRGWIEECDSAAVIPVSPPTNQDRSFTAEDLRFTLELMQAQDKQEPPAAALDPAAYALARGMFADRQRMVGISNAAQYLDVPVVTEMVASHFVDSTVGMAPPQIREFMGLPPWESMTPEDILKERESDAVKMWIYYLTR
jgi:hypothetical protein